MGEGLLIGRRCALESSQASESCCMLLGPASPPTIVGLYGSCMVSILTGLVVLPGSGNSMLGLSGNPLAYSCVTCTPSGWSVMPQLVFLCTVVSWVVS